MNNGSTHIIIHPILNPPLVVVKVRWLPVVIINVEVLIISLAKKRKDNQ